MLDHKYSNGGAISRRRGARGRNDGGLATVGCLVLTCVTLSFLLIFVAAYAWSYTNDLKRQLVQKSAEAGGGGGRAPSPLDEEAMAIIRECDEYFSRDRLKDIAFKTKSTYRNAYPYPSHVFDDLFPESILRKIIEEHPESILKNGCIPGVKNCEQESYEGQHLKSSIQNWKDMGFFTKIFFGYLKSSSFILFLQDLSGIGGIVPDPHFMGAGLHFVAPGGKLDIHSDFNAHVTHKLERRVNILLFLNDDWKEEYGGHLELWSKDMKSCGQKIRPKLGRMAVFSTTDFSYHGHPHPLTAPEGRARRSIAMYYYTTKRPKQECLNGVCAFESDFKHYHSTLFKTPVGCSDCEDAACNALPSPNPYQ